MTSSRVGRMIVLLLVTLAIIYVSIIVLHMIEKTNDHEFLYFSEASVGIGIILVFILLMNRATFVHMVADKDKSVLNNSPFEYAIYDLRNKTILVQDRLAESFGINNAQNEDQFLSVFSLEDEEDIRSKMHSYSMIESFSKTGMVRISKDGNEYFFDFWCKFIKDQLGNKHIAFWFHDVTKEVIDKIDLVKILQKYRVENFQHLSTLEAVPFPIWYKNESNELIFKNKALLKTIKELQFDPLTINSKAREGELNKKFLKDGKVKIYNFKEMETDFEGGRVGFGVDITDAINTMKNMKSIENILGKLIDNLTVGFLILDHEQRVINYNAAFQNLFNMESSTLSQRPHYRYILDILREKKLFPELKGYKEQHLATISAVRDYTSDLLHMPDGNTIKLTIIPSTDNNTIIIYENITPNLEVEREIYNIKLMMGMLLNLIQKPIVIFDIQGRSLSYNNYFFDLFIKDTEIEFTNTLDLSALELVCNTPADLFRAQFNKCIEERRCQPVEIVIKNVLYKVEIHALYDMGVALIFTNIG